MPVSSNSLTRNQQNAVDIIRHRQQGYKHTFSPEDRFAKIVLADLARFCRANVSTFHPDQRMSDVLQGRREVWLRICEHLNLSEQELYEKLK